MAHVIILGKMSVAQAARQAAAVLEDGGVIVYPTDTLYGLGCLFNREDSLLRLFEAKGRPQHMPLPVMIGEKDDVTTLAVNVSADAWKAADVFWPGALTIVLEARRDIPRLLLGGGTSIGIRLPDSDLCREIVRRAGFPVVTTSANRTGEPPIMSVSELPGAIADCGAQLIIDGGAIERGIPSSVIDLSGGKPVLLREGSISYEELKQVFPCLEPVSR